LTWLHDFNRDGFARVERVFDASDVEAWFTEFRRIWPPRGPVLERTEGRADLAGKIVPDRLDPVIGDDLFLLNGFEQLE